MKLQHLREARKGRKVTQKELARRLGWTQAYVSYVEHGKRDVSEDKAYRIAEALNCEFNDLVEVQYVPVASWLR